MNAENLQYPIGKYVAPKEYSEDLLKNWMQEIENFPVKFSSIAEELTDAQLGTRYRPEGWTARQVIHHVADSHMNAFIRFKLTLTEDTPTIKPYLEHKWAQLADVQLPISVSLQIVEAVHQRWVVVLKNMKREDFDRTYNHPQYDEILPLCYALGLYVWHGEHHLAHIKLCM